MRRLQIIFILFPCKISVEMSFFFDLVGSAQDKKIKKKKKRLSLIKTLEKWDGKREKLQKKDFLNIFF